MLQVVKDTEYRITDNVKQLGVPLELRFKTEFEAMLYLREKTLEAVLKKFFNEGKGVEKGKEKLFIVEVSKHEVLLKMEQTIKQLGVDLESVTGNKAYSAVGLQGEVTIQALDDTLQKAYYVWAAENNVPSIIVTAKGFKEIWQSDLR